jgi:hypothetical protein
MHGDHIARLSAIRRILDRAERSSARTGMDVIARRRNVEFDGAEWGLQQACQHDEKKGFHQVFGRFFSKSRKQMLEERSLRDSPCVSFSAKKPGAACGIVCNTTDESLRHPRFGQ